MPKFPTTRRLILRKFPAKISATRFAVSRNWSKYSETPPGYDSSGKMRRAEIMWLVHPGLAFFYVENDLSDDCCVGLIDVSGEPLDAQAEELLQELDRSLETWSMEELLDLADRASLPADLARATMRVGLGAPVEFNQEFYERINRAASNPDPMVREAAINATMYPAWPQFRVLLRSLAESDPVQSVRDLAVSMLGSFDRVGVPES